MLYLLETLPGKCDIGAGHRHKVTFLAGALSIANILSHLCSVVYMRNIIRDVLETATKVLDVAIGNLEKEEGLYSLGQAIKEDISLDVLEIECRHGGICGEANKLLRWY